MNKLFIASSNPHKLEEIRDILLNNGIDLELVCPKDFGCEEEPVEDGLSFEENAYIKARFYHDLYHLPTIADDSGICIDYLGGKPGIHSARFLPEMDYPHKCAYIVDIMKDVSERSARFVDCLCFIDGKGSVHYYQGVNEGTIAYEPAGDKGFGYDPIFVIPEYGKTEAELGEEYKNVYSHRAKALKEWIIDAKEKFQ
ncbi:MAG: RdgB/HAM1 family non-canonical purine NTP pyrophosphatase [Erysipelotrichaceae bacterium]|nr:RdgB/HAM1 family non-canonical purine NTP pyrophosphatase [Erysipelotrichaceae bacterium]